MKVQISDKLLSQLYQLAEKLTEFRTPPVEGLMAWGGIRCLISVESVTSNRVGIYGYVFYIGMAHVTIFKTGGWTGDSYILTDMFPAILDRFEFAIKRGAHLKAFRHYIGPFGPVIPEVELSGVE